MSRRRKHHSRQTQHRGAPAQRKTGRTIKPAPRRASNGEIARLVLLWFAASRALLTLVGVLAREFVGPRPHIGSMAVAEQLTGLKLQSGQAWLDIWGVWDTRWYVEIAQNWYSAAADSVGYNSYAFFPLYPLLMKPFAFVPGGAYIGGVVVSNLALIAAAWLLYRLVEARAGVAIAKRALGFMFLFPTAFLFSGVLTEALFLALSLGSFYFARRRNWFAASLLGGLCALTRSVGVFLAPLLLLEYIKARGGIKNIRADVLFLGLVPLGLLLFMWQCYALTGDWLAFATTQQGAWLHDFSNPVSVIWGALSGGEMPEARFGAVFGGAVSVGALVLAVAGRKQIGTTWCLWILVLVLFPLWSSSPLVPVSMARYALVAFPLFAVIAHLTADARIRYATAAGFAIAQIYLMALWTNNFRDLI